MLYVIQTETGKELETVKEMMATLDKEVYNEIFTIRYENVLRIKGIYKIERKILFPSYIFVETDTPDLLFLQLKNILNLSVLLSDKSESGYEFFSVSRVEEELLRKLINENENYIVTLSLVAYNKKKRINKAAGPLKYFINKITEVDNRHRRAFVEMEFLGRPRRLVFGICTKGDGLTPDGMEKLEEEMSGFGSAGMGAGMTGFGNAGGGMNGSVNEENAIGNAYTVGYGSNRDNPVRDYNLKTIEVGDFVIIREDLYGDEPVKVVDKNGKKNTVTVEVPLFGQPSKIEMSGMDVEKVEENRG